MEIWKKKKKNGVKLDDDINFSRISTEENEFPL